MDLETAKDRIYEAAILPDRWPSVLDTIAEIAGAVGSILIGDDSRDPFWINSSSLDGFLEDFMAGQWGQIDSRMPKLLAANRSGFLIEEDVYTNEELSNDALIQDFLKPRGFGWATATFVNHAGGGRAVFSIERRFADGPVPRSAVQVLDALRCDLARAASLSAKSGLSKGRAAVDILASLSLPAGVLSRNGRLIVVNEKLSPLMPDLVRDGRERMAFSEPHADLALSALLEGGARTLPATIPVRRRDGFAPHVAHFLPVTGAVRDVFCNGLSIMILKEVAVAAGPAPHLLRPLFDLTSAEAHVLSELAEGRSPAEIAERHQVSIETVRSQLKALFNKTDERRQVDLVRLVAGIANPV